jgi:beta-glucosidase
MPRPPLPAWKFTWGVATSAFQIEGASSADGKGPSIWDTFCRTPGNMIDGSNGDVACDHYHRYREDVALMADAGRGRLPLLDGVGARAAGRQGCVERAGFDFYERLLDALQERGIAAAPDAVPLGPAAGPAGRRAAGWRATPPTASPTTPAEVARRFGDRLVTIATHNEPWCTANLGYGNAQFAPGVADAKQAVQVSHHLLLSHGLAMQAMRAAVPSAEAGHRAEPVDRRSGHRFRGRPRAGEAGMGPLGAVVHGPDLQGPLPGTRPAPPRRQRAAGAMEGDFDIIAQPLDFLGVNYYFREVMQRGRRRRAKPEGGGLHRHGLGDLPQGLTELLLKLKAEYELPPIYITENGMANPDRPLVDGGACRHAAHRVRAHPPGGAEGGDGPGRGRARLLPLEPAGQLRMEFGLRQALRHRPRRLRHPEAHAEGQRAVVPRLHRQPDADSGAAAQ